MSDLQYYIDYQKQKSSMIFHILITGLILVNKVFSDIDCVDRNFREATQTISFSSYYSNAEHCTWNLPDINKDMGIVTILHLRKIYKNYNAGSVTLPDGTEVKPVETNQYICNVYTTNESMQLHPTTYHGNTCSTIVLRRQYPEWPLKLTFKASPSYYENYYNMKVHFVYALIHLPFISKYIERKLSNEAISSYTDCKNKSLDETTKMARFSSWFDNIKGCSWNFHLANATKDTKIVTLMYVYKKYNADELSGSVILPAGTQINSNNYTAYKRTCTVYSRSNRTHFPITFLGENCSQTILHGYEWPPVFRFQGKSSFTGLYDYNMDVTLHVSVRVPSTIVATTDKRESGQTEDQDDITDHLIMAVVFAVLWVLTLTAGSIILTILVKKLKKANNLLNLCLGDSKTTCNRTNQSERGSENQTANEENVVASRGNVEPTRNELCSTSEDTGNDQYSNVVEKQEVHNILYSSYQE